MAIYVIGYGIGRFWVEGLRIDPAEELGGLRWNQWVSLAAIVGGLIVLWVLEHRPSPAIAGEGAPPAEVEETSDREVDEDTADDNDPRGDAEDSSDGEDTTDDDGNSDDQDTREDADDSSDDQRDDADDSSDDQRDDQHSDADSSAPDARPAEKPLGAED